MNKLGLKYFSAWIFYSSFFVSLCAWALFRFFNPADNVFDQIIVFAASFILYNLLKLRGTKSEYLLQNADQIKWIKHHERSIYILILVAAIVGLYSWSQVNFEVKTNFVFAAVFLFAYILFRTFQSERYFPTQINAFFKIINVSIVWSLVILDSRGLDMQYFPAVLFLICGLMIPFEIKDMPYDKPFGVRTIPLLFSLPKTKDIGLAFMSLSLATFTTYNSTKQNFIWLITCFAGSVVIYLSSEKRGELYYLFAVDGVMCLPLLIATFINR